MNANNFLFPKYTKSLLLVMGHIFMTQPLFSLDDSLPHRKLINLSSKYVTGSPCASVCQSEQ